MRLGTRKSRAPSGDEAVRIGVEYSAKPIVAHAPAHRGDDLGALDDVGVQRLAAQVEEAVAQADILGIVRLAEHRQRQFLGLAQHFELADEHFDRAGRLLGVDRLGRARLDLAVDADHPLGAHRLGELEGGGIGIDHQLRQAVMVAQIDEQQAAMVADAVHPARQPHIIAHVRRRQSGAGVGAIAVHFQVSFEGWSRAETAPDKRMRGAGLSRFPAAAGATCRWQIAAGAAASRLIRAT